MSTWPGFVIAGLKSSFSIVSHNLYVFALSHYSCWKLLLKSYSHLTSNFGLTTILRYWYFYFGSDCLITQYHWILALHSTPSTTPFSSVDYKPASAYLDSPLHDSTPILRGVVNLSVLAVPYLQVLCAPRAFRKDLFFVLCFFPYSSHSLHILSVHMTPCSISTLTTQLYVAISNYNYDTPDAKLELCLSTLHTWFCYNGLALNPDKSEAIVFGTTHYPALTFSSNYLYCQCGLVQVSNQIRILGVTLDSRLSFDAHILHFQNPVSITSVHSATSVPTSH